MKRFEVLEVGLEVVRSLRSPLQGLLRRNPDLFRQIRRAAESVVLNIAEGGRRTGKDRLHHFRVAAGSADEVRAAIRVAEAWGEVESGVAGKALELIDRVLAMLCRLTR